MAAVGRLTGLNQAQATNIRIARRIGSLAVAKAFWESRRPSVPPGIAHVPPPRGHVTGGRGVYSTSRSRSESRRSRWGRVAYPLPMPFIYRTEETQRCTRTQTIELSVGNEGRRKACKRIARCDRSCLVCEYNKKEASRFKIPKIAAFGPITCNKLLHTHAIACAVAFPDAACS